MAPTFSIRLPKELGDKLRDWGLLKLEPLAFLLSDFIARRGIEGKPVVREWAETMIRHHTEQVAVYRKLRWAAMSDEERLAETGGES